MIILVINTHVSAHVLMLGGGEASGKEEKSEDEGEECSGTPLDFT